jgi:spore coat protein CotF
MASLIGNIVKNNTDITDDVILTNMLGSSKATATAYFNATMTGTTPELKSMFSSAMVQVMNEHSILTELAVKHGWEKPYNSPAQQLADVYKHSTAEMQ